MREKNFFFPSEYKRKCLSSVKALNWQAIVFCCWTQLEFQGTQDGGRAGHAHMLYAQHSAMLEKSTGDKIELWTDIPYLQSPSSWDCPVIIKAAIHGLICYPNH